MNETTLLSQLKDIHTVSRWWEFAPLWYVVMTLGGVIIIFAIKFAYKKFLKALKNRKILKELDVLLNAYKIEPKTIYLAKANILLKRVMMAKGNKVYIASLCDRDWLLYLDKISGSCDFTEGSGQVLISQPYQSVATPVPEVFSLIKQTMLRCL